MTDQTEGQGYRSRPAAAPGWYPLPGGGQRYWDGRGWVGDPVPSNKRVQEPSKPGMIGAAIGVSLLLTPIVGIIMGLFRLRKNRSDGWKMIGGSLAVWAVVVMVLVLVNALGS